MIRVAVAGAGGRMGREVVRAVTEAPDMDVVARIERDDDLQAILSETRPDALVDFTIPDAVMGNLRIALTARVVPIVGTTGLTPAHLEEVRSLCEQHQTGCLVAPNFAIGAVLLMRFAAEAARYLPDVEIIEMHHEHKLDAPSGTAIKTAEMIGEGSELRVPSGCQDSVNTQYLPHGGRATPNTQQGGVSGVRGGVVAGVQIHSVRLPGFVASQEVIFGGPGQRLSLRHDSMDRASFMPGVLLALRKAHTLTGLVYGLEHLM